MRSHKKYTCSLGGGIILLSMSMSSISVKLINIQQEFDSITLNANAYLHFLGAPLIKHVLGCLIVPQAIIYRLTLSIHYSAYAGVRQNGLKLQIAVS